LLTSVCVPAGTPVALTTALMVIVWTAPAAREPTLTTIGLAPWLVEVM
jgi:hypothetical protein